MPDSARLLVGTKKGMFIYTSDRSRNRWQLSPPMLPGWSVFNMAADTRDGGKRLYSGANHFAWGPSVAKNTNGGEDWDYHSPGLGFPKDMGVAIQNIWSVAPGHKSQPGVVFAGTQPAGLFRSEDWGQNWMPVDGINRHPDRQRWAGTGGGDSCLHSIEIDPRDAKHMYIAISSGGSYETKDGGETWKMFSQTAVPKSDAALAFMKQIEETIPDATVRDLPPDIDPPAIDEMHKMRLDAKNPDRMWTQTHVGVFRSDDAGKTWKDVTQGLPSFHGFPIGVTRSGPDAAYVVPLEIEGDNFRVCRGQFAVYRTRDGGGSWERLTEGLPGPDDYQSAYREALDTDGLNPEGVYVGTSNGQMYGSTDGGDHWQRLPGTLPPILSVTCATM